MRQPNVLDRNKREHLAQIEAVVFHNESDDYVIVRLNDGHTAKGNQPKAFFSHGILYRFMGRWFEGQRGPEFRFDSVIVDAPMNRVGVVRYLTDFASNVGAARAEKLWQRYAGESVRILREEPGRVSEDGIMPLEAAVEASGDLKKNAALERTKIDLFGLLSGRGFHGKLITQAIKKWGAKAPDIIRRNPFSPLLNSMAGAGFKRCDKLWLDLGKPATALKRQMLSAWNWMRVESRGNTWYPVEEAGEAIKLAIQSYAVSPVKALILGKRSGWLRFRRDAERKLWVAEAKKAANEQMVADACGRLSAWTGERLWPESLPVSQVEGDGLPSQHQVERALQALSGSVGCLIGSPGTGKTHVLAFILREVIAKVGRDAVAVVAPTGKAANRATQSLRLQGLPIRATTVHSRLGIGKNGHVDGDWGFVFNRTNPMPIRVLIVDETSMVDTDLMAAILEACADGTHVLFVGDTHQLPPVGHGAPLRDIIAAGIPTGELTQVRRNAGRIVHACLRIKNGESFEAAPSYNPETGDNLLFLETTSDDKTMEVLTRLVSNSKRFNPVTQTQIITGIKKRGPLSVPQINDRMHKILNPNGIGDPGNPFRVDDKIICLRNSRMATVRHVRGADLADASRYEPVYEMGSNEPAEVFVANGEIGFVVAVSARLTIARMGEDDTLIKIPMGKQQHAAGQEDGSADENGRESEGEGDRGRGCNFDLAYAITVHKSQGSEAPCIICLVDSRASMIADRNFWYTAISRASRLCVIIGDRGVLDKQRVKQSLVRRKTFLKELIEEGRKNGSEQVDAL